VAISKSIETVKYCQEYFDFSLQSVSWAKRAKLKWASSVFCLCYNCLISFVLLIVCCLPCLLGEWRFLLDIWMRIKPFADIFRGCLYVHCQRRMQDFGRYAGVSKSRMRTSMSINKLSYERKSFVPVVVERLRSSARPLWLHHRDISQQGVSRLPNPIHRCDTRVFLCASNNWQVGPIYANTRNEKKTKSLS